MPRIFDSDMADLIHEEAKQKGIDLKLGESVTGFSGKDRVESVKTDQHTYSTDFVLLAIGVLANTQFLQGTGIHLNPRGGYFSEPIYGNVTEKYLCSGRLRDGFSSDKTEG